MREPAYPVFLYRHQIHDRAELFHASEGCKEYKHAYSDTVIQGHRVDEEVEHDAGHRHDEPLKH